MSEGSAQIRILAVDDHVLVREDIAVLISSEPDLTLVAESSNGPGLFNIDMAAIEYFPINERMRFQFRAEFFNLLNNVNFTVPGLGSASPNESAA